MENNEQSNENKTTVIGGKTVDLKPIYQPKGFNESYEFLRFGGRYVDEMGEIESNDDYQSRVNLCAEFELQMLAQGRDLKELQAISAGLILPGAKNVKIAKKQRTYKQGRL